MIHASEAQLSSLRSDHDAFGTRMASNDHVTVLALNDVSYYMYFFTPFGPENSCAYAYSSSQNFIMTVAIGQKQNATHMSYVYLRANDANTSYLELVLHQINPTICLTVRDAHQENELVVFQFLAYLFDVWILKMDSLSEYVYGFVSDFSFIFDINNVNVTIIKWSELLPDVSTLYSRDADISITNDGVQVAILVGYFKVNRDLSLPAIYLLRLEPPSAMFLIDNLTLINDSFIGDASAYGYDFDSVVSVSIEHTTQQVIVGLPYFSRTFVLKFNSTNITLMKIFSYAARSVTWIDNGTQAALLLSDTPTLPWAASQVQVINTSAVNTKLATLFAIPNNQQTITSKSSKQSTNFIRIGISNGQPIILLSTGFILYARIVPADHYIRLIDLSADIPRPESCPAGTFKNHAGPSPCTVCSTGFKKAISDTFSSNMENVTMSTNFDCIPCLSSSFCPLASVNDVNISSYPSINQGYPYPNSPASTNFDDIIITNTFQLSASNGHCLVVSPLFWTLIVLGLTVIILIIMGILYFIPNGRRHFTWLTSILKHTDIVGEGELWMGGLMSFALLVLIVFGFWFGLVYANQYPIETVGDSNFACDLSLRNAKFSSNLQLLALLKTADELPVFELLDQQNWTLTVDFIQTGFKCEDILVQGNIESYKIILPVAKCLLQPDNATRTLTVPLNSHLITVQFNLTGNSYIGASRICIYGPSTTRNESYSSIKELAFCQLISTTDQTISQLTNVKLDFTKVINRTEGFGTNDPTSYSGIWIPTFIIKSFNDRIAFEQQGDYLRYLSSQQTLVIELSETQFFIKNIQEPIARSGEIIFHNILFSTVCIELFGLAFLLFKLALLPILRLIIRKTKNQHCSKRSNRTKF